jgi:CMP-N,N'-diacetyllegionaminic acid synthase
MKTLFVIPARGGSKGIPKKNIKLLSGHPLICYSIDIARLFANDADICVSTDSDEIIDVVQNYGLSVPFKRPPHLSEDNSGTDEVLRHAIDFFLSKGIYYDNLMLLQPTSPFRTKKHVSDVLSMYTNEIDMVVSVNVSHHNPYFNLFEENKSGFLQKSKTGYFQNRQEIPAVYAYNGSLYLINVAALQANPLHKLEKIKKYVMDDLYAVDIDTPLDWAVCETIIKEGYIKNENG